MLILADEKFRNSPQGHGPDNGEKKKKKKTRVAESVCLSETSLKAKQINAKYIKLVI